jgi:8-oxo-dGTP diphosphatase
VVQQVAAAALLRSGRVLAARRAGPSDVAGGWELPGGKLEPSESAATAVAREVREELGCEIRVDGRLPGRAPIKPGYELSVHLAVLTAGEPMPQEHDALRWLSPEELDEVAWLPADRPFLPQLRVLLLDGHRLAGGNVGGAVRIGATVRRAVGAWSPAVHALLAHLNRCGFVDVPRVLGTDERGREVLTYLPGRVLDVDTEVPSEAALRSAMSWLRRYHDAVDGAPLDGPWRTTNRPMAPGELICHHDFAPYNVALSSSATGEQVVGVFDWDMAGPGNRVEDLAFAAWNWVPLHRPLPGGQVARRLRLMAAAYGSAVTSADIAAGVAPRIERAVRVIAAGQAAGDPGMLNLAEVGEPERTARSLADLRERLPSVLAALRSHS